MMREMEEMDRVTESYQRTLIALKPKLKNKKLEDLIKGSSDEEEESVEEEKFRRKKKKKTKQEPKRRQKTASRRRPQEEQDEEEGVEEEYREQQQFEDTTPLSEQPHRGREPPKISANDKWKTAKGTTAPPQTVENMSNQNRNMVMLEAEYDPNSKVKTFTSVRPIVVSRKTNLNALFPHLADEIAQEEEQSGGSQAQTPLVEGEIPLKKSALSGPKTATTPNPLATNSSKKTISPMIISSKPKPSLSIPVMPQSSHEQEQDEEEEYTPLQTVTGEDSSPENRNWNMTADSLGSKLAAPNRLQQNTELLMDFAKKRKESHQEQQQGMDYTMRSSMGGADSTVAMSVDSLNMTNNQQIPVTNTVARGGGGGNERNSFANRPLDVHTWTPTSSVNKAAIQSDDQEDQYYEDEQEPIKNRVPLAKTFPPLSSSKIRTHAETSLMTETSILMESFEEGDDERQRMGGREGGEMDFTVTNEMERDSLMLTHTTLQSTLPTPMTTVQKQQSNRLSIEIEEKPKRNIIIEREYEYEEEEDQQQQDLAEDQSPSPRQFHSSEAKAYPLSATYYAAKRTGENKPLHRSSSFKQSADPFTSSSYLDEDDPFSPQGRPNTSFFPNTNDDQINNNNNTDDLDIDASQSYTIDFDIAESKPSKHHPQQQKAVNIPPPKSPYSRVSSQRTLLEEDSYENSMSSTQKSSPFSTHNNDSTSNLLHDVVGENVSQENEDFVLLGTGKYPTKTNFNLTDSFADRNTHQSNHDIHGNTMSTNDSSANYSDDFEDGGANNTNTKFSNNRDHNQSQDDDQSNNPLEASSYLDASQEDQDRSYQEHLRSSRNAKNDLNMTPINTSGYSGGGGGAINQSTELSPVFQGLNQMGDSHSQIGDLSYSSMMVPREESKQQQSIIPSNTTAQWEKGRAAIDLLELATALEVHISAVRLNSNVSRIVKEVGS
jgi:hypothetical protein